MLSNRTIVADKESLGVDHDKKLQTEVLCFTRQLACTCLLFPNHDTVYAMKISIYSCDFANVCSMLAFVLIFICLSNAHILVTYSYRAKLKGGVV